MVGGTLLSTTVPSSLMRMERPIGVVITMFSMSATLLRNSLA